MIGQRLANLLQSRFQFGEMRAGPIDLAAIRTAAEILVVDFREWFELIENVGFAYFHEQTVASDAARIWRDKLSQIKSAGHFDDLLVGLVRSWTIAVLHDFVHEQTAISCEQSAVVSTTGGE